MEQGVRYGGIPAAVRPRIARPGAPFPFREIWRDSRATTPAGVLSPANHAKAREMKTGQGAVGLTSHFRMPKCNQC